MIFRPARPEDAGAMAAILNEIIAIGGTTAHQHPKTPALVDQDYIRGADVLSSVVAEDASGVIGWQSSALWQGEAHIGSFVRPGIQARGVGAGLFALTLQILRQKPVPAIVATIRADNVPGLAYYGRLGFVDFAAEPDYALEDGRVVGRVHRRFSLV